MLIISNSTDVNREMCVMVCGSIVKLAVDFSLVADDVTGYLLRMGQLHRKKVEEVF